MRDHWETLFGESQSVSVEITDTLDLDKCTFQHVDPTCKCKRIGGWQGFQA